MNRKFITVIAFAGNIVLFSACNQTTPSDKNEASTNLTTGASTSGSHLQTTSGQSQHQKMSQEMMQMMQNGMMQMKQMKMTGDPDYDFASMMAMHHENGIKLADKEISNGKDMELVSLAKKMKQQQEAEKKELKTFTSNHKPSGQDKAFMDAMKKNMDMSESDMNKMTTTGNTDKDFAMMMNMHHKHGIKMEETEMKYGKDEKLKAMAKKSMENQKNEMKELEKLGGKKEGM